VPRVWLLAQLIEAPLQPGPIRLPERAPLERPSQPPRRDEGPILQDQPQLLTPAQPAKPRQNDPQPPQAPTQRPAVEGSTPYTPTELDQILKGCVQANETPAGNLRRCAAALTTRLVQDGFVNSRVYVQDEPKPGRLEVVEGRIVEVRVSSGDAVLERSLSKRLRSLQGAVLNLKSLEQTLVQLRALPRVGQIRGNLGRLGTDPAQAVLNLRVEAAALPWQGEIGLRNDGNAGSGEWRALGITLKNDWLQRGDTFLVVGELNADQQAELGSTISSVSYTLPLAESLKFTGSFGYSRRNLVEATGILRNIATRQFQGYGQMDWTFKESLQDRWTLFAGISGNRNDVYLSGVSIIPPARGGWGQTGYARIGISGNGSRSGVSWSGNVYGLQGMPSFSTNAQLNTLAEAGISPGSANAIGAILSASWAISPKVLISARGAGQVAFNELTPDMGFNIGSDTGLKGLPGSYISGDNGYLWTTELSWTFWNDTRQALQLSPFIGAGGIHFWRKSKYFSDTVGSTGVLLRWLSGRHWNLELGWVSPFDTEQRPYWTNWLLSSGVYTKLQYRF
jgi:hemolysin activation/secretion protein